MTDTALPSSPRKYELLGLTGSGNMGLVYRARLLALGHDVAMKVPHPGPRYTRRIAELFVREAQITASLIHPGVPSPHDLDPMPDGRPFFAMELIQGRTLAESIHELQRSTEQSIRVFESICQTVGYAHQCGVIHCDLEPSNVLMEASGEIKVIDWGLAKLMPGAKDNHEMRDAGDATVRYGSPAYMSPEQAGGDVEAVDQRSDVFGLGAVLCELLTGQPPYLAPDQIGLRRLAVFAELDNAFRRLDRCGADKRLVQLCKRCLSADPDDRPSDAIVVAQDFSL